MTKKMTRATKKMTRATTAADRLDEGPAVAKAVVRALAQYRAICPPGDQDPATRYLAFTASIETATTLHGSDAELAAAVRSVVAEDQERDAFMQGEAG